MLQGERQENRETPRADPPEDATDALEHRLRESLSGEVRFDKGSRALYATDGSLYRQVPIGVILPRSLEDVVQAIKLCREADVPVLARGGGTSLAGQCCNVAVLLDFSKYLDNIIHLDPETRLARVEPGCVLDVLRDAAETHYLTFAPDPSTHAHNTLGGMLGNNSCGVHSVMAGRTADNVRRMEVLTYEGDRFSVGPTGEAELAQIIKDGGRKGEIYAALKRLRDRYARLIRDRYPAIPRRVSGYNLNALLPENGFNVARALVGSEGTCVTILEAEMELVPSPPERCLVLLGYEDVYASGEHVMEVLEYRPIGLEGMDNVLLNAMETRRMHPEGRELLPPGDGWLLVEFGGATAREATDQARDLMTKLGDSSNPPAMALINDSADQELVWAVREAGLGATSRAEDLGNTFPGWEDAAVPPERVGEYLCAFRKLLHRFGYEGPLYGHFGDGCIHSRINFNFRTEDGVAQWHEFMNEAADLVVRFGGSISGEHGDGQVRADLLPRMYGQELMDAFREFKSIWDPRGRMNPGKIVDPYPATTSLRYGPDTIAPVLKTVFDFDQDDHSFMAAVDRCVGIGNCRNMSGGVMCPSYRATREEKHSTRGRARLLFEMLKGDTLRDGWADEAVSESLDLCLACKGCKSDCPVSVDMATYKAEFMSHHYEGRLRPRAAYSMGLIWWWSRVASVLPRSANFFLQTPGVSRIIKKLGGIAAQRQMPRYARTTFRHWFERRERRHDSRPVSDPGAPRLVLWPDTFNNHFHPEILRAATKVLENAGYRVTIPEKPLCCGRPLYAEGMLKLARSQLASILETLSDEITHGIPVIGLEPSCVASFRDELPQLFSGDERAHVLSRNTWLLSEFLHKENYHPPPLNRRALVHMHCHQHSSLDPMAEQHLLKSMGVDAQVLNAGCCGMAGSFGFDASKYDVSQTIAEHELFPALRKADPEALIITNGFSCREQILQGTGLRALNMAEVLSQAQHNAEEIKR